MSWLSQWLKEIIMVILLATFIDLLLPNRSMQRYVKLMLSLIILMILLTPIMKLFHENIAEDVANEWNKAAMETTSAFTSLTAIEREAAKLTAKREEQARQFAASQLGSNMKGHVNEMLQASAWPEDGSSQSGDIPVFVQQGLYAETERVEVRLMQAAGKREPAIEKIVVFLNVTKGSPSRQAGDSDEASSSSNEVDPVQAVPKIDIGSTSVSDSKQEQIVNMTAQEARAQVVKETESLIIKALTTQWLVQKDQISFVWDEKK